MPWVGRAVAGPGSRSAVAAMASDNVSWKAAWTYVVVMSGSNIDPLPRIRQGAKIFHAIKLNWSTHARSIGSEKEAISLLSSGFQCATSDPAQPGHNCENQSGGNRLAQVSEPCKPESDGNCDRDVELKNYGCRAVNVESRAAQAMKNNSHRITS
jgi:hypothetical protein